MMFFNLSGTSSALRKALLRDDKPVEFNFLGQDRQRHFHQISLVVIGKATESCDHCASAYIQIGSSAQPLLHILLVSQACMASRPSSVMGKVSLPSISLFS